MDKLYYEHTLQFQRMQTGQPIHMPNIPSLVASQVQVLEQKNNKYLQTIKNKCPFS